MKKQIINFKNKLNSYSIIIGENALDQLTEKIAVLCPKTRKIALIIDDNVPARFKNKFKKKLKKYELSFFSFEASEKSKSLKTVNFFFK